MGTIRAEYPFFRVLVKSVGQNEEQRLPIRKKDSHDFIQIMTVFSY